MGKFTAYNIPLKALTQGEHAFDFHLDKQFFENMEFSDARDADIDVALKVVYRNDIYALHFQFSGHIVVPCDRCLDDLPIEINTSYDISVQYGDDYNDDSDQLLIIPHSDNSLNVSYMIFDTVVLAIPLKHVHPMGKCNKAMSAILRQHRADIDDDTPDDDTDAIDPRWEALRTLASDTDSLE